MKKSKRILLLFFLIAFAISVTVVWSLLMESNSTPQLDLKIPSSDVVQQYFAQEYDFKLMKQKGLCKKGKMDKEYLYAQALYGKALKEYLSTYIDLEEYEERLQGGEYHFKEQNLNSFFKEYSAFSSKFFYLCQTVHIEYLEQEDVDLLINRVQSGNINVDEELLSLVERSYSNVLKLHTSEYIPAQSTINIVFIKFAYSLDYDENGNIISRETEQKKQEYLNNYLQSLSAEWSDLLGREVVVVSNG